MLVAVPEANALIAERFTREYSVESLDFALDLAAREDKLVDVHCDEIDDEASRGLETVAARALELGLYDKVTASHTTAMHSYNNAYVMRLMRLLKMRRTDLSEYDLKQAGTANIY